MTKNSITHIAPWGSEEAIRKEKHVARFLEREYRAAQNSPVSLEEMGVSSSTGPMWEETEELIETHYDEQMEFFESFLDRRYRAYSMAYYGENPEEILEGGVSLEEAQENKFKLICDRIGLQGDERILNIGCGFGSFEKYLIEEYPDVCIVGITPSNVQVRYLSSCIEDAKCKLNSDNFTVIQDEFDNIPIEMLGRESFDVVVSIGLLEQVKNMDVLNKKISELLKGGGKSFHHFIVSKILIPQFLDASKTIIGDYFPGGRIWPLVEFEKHDSHLEFIESWFINGMNYWSTLDEWHKRFWENMPILTKSLSEDKLAFWNDYFILCKACFLPDNGTFFGNAHYLFRKPA